VISKKQTWCRLLSPAPRLLVLVCLAVGAAACGTGASLTTSTTASKASTTTLAPTTPLSVPKTNTVQDSAYLEDVAKADSALAVYVQQQGATALRTMLTDGSAFCAFLQRDRSVNDAISAVAVGAQSVESKTHLPLEVRTFNTMEAVALLTLCSPEQSLLPSDDRAKIRSLGAALNK
jgi:hypothetical protein